MLLDKSFADVKKSKFTRKNIIRHASERGKNRSEKKLHFLYSFSRFCFCLTLYACQLTHGMRGIREIREGGIPLCAVFD